MKTIAQMQEEVVAFCHDKGWSGPDSPPKTFGDCMALLHSEISEAVEAYRNWGLRDATPDSLRPHHQRCAVASVALPTMRQDRDVSEGGDCTCSVQGHNRLAKPEGVGSEFADVFIRLLDDCDRFNIDLEMEYERKMGFNRTRPFRHGGKSL